MDLLSYYCQWKYRHLGHYDKIKFLICGCMWDVVGGHKDSLCARHGGQPKRTYLSLLSALIYRMSWDVCDLMNGKLLKRLFRKKRKPAPEPLEAIIPLSELGRRTVDGTTVIFEVDGRQIAAATVPHLPGVVKRFIPEGPRKEPQ